MTERSNLKYCPAYCEENIWHLCQHSQLAECEKIVVLITNELRACALWHQRAAPSELEPVYWDYHVILLARETRWLIWDLDTQLDLPIGANSYLTSTFPGSKPIEPMLAPRFRLVDAGEFVRRFSSDRSHMRDADGNWLSPPPSWPAILSSDPITLAEYLNTDPSSPSDETIGLNELMERFGDYQASSTSE